VIRNLTVRVKEYGRLVGRFNELTSFGCIRLVGERMCIVIGDDRDDVTLMSPDILFVCFGIMECMTATSQHQGTAAGLAPLDGSPSRDGDNCLKVADRMALHNMLRRTTDLY